MKKITAMAMLAAAGLATTAMARPAYVGAGFNIPDNNAAGNQSTLSVGDAFAITDMSVTITFPLTVGGAGGAHTWCGDLIATLTGPAGTITFLNRIGSTTSAGVGDSSDMAGAYTFSDSSSASIWTAALGTTLAVPQGTYEAQTRSATFAYQRVNMLSTFGGTGSAGNWTLKITDNAGGDTGGISSWTLNLSPTPGAASLLGLGGLTMIRRRR